MILLHCKYVIVEYLGTIQSILFPISMRDSDIQYPGTLISAGRVFMNPLNNGIECYGEMFRHVSRVEDNEILKRAYFHDV